MQLNSLNDSRDIDMMLSKSIGYSSLVLACVALVLFGILGVFRNAQFAFDFDVFHFAANNLVNGINPWLEPAKKDLPPFSYPPHISSWLILYSFFSLEMAKILHTILGLCSLTVILILINKWYLKIENLKSITAEKGFALALVIGSPFTAHVVFLGQTTLPCIAAAMLSWHFYRVHRNVFLAGLCLGFATIKPQVSFFLIVWLIINLEITILVVGAGVALLLMAPALIVLGPIEAFSSWFESMGYYKTAWANQPGSPNVISLDSFLVASGIGKINLSLVGIVGVVIMRLYQSKLDHIVIYALFNVLALTFVYGHDGDYVITNIVWSYAFFLAWASGRKLNVVIFFTALTIFYFPQRFIRVWEIPLLTFIRTFDLILISGLLLYWSRKIVSTNPQSAKNSLN